MLRFALLTVYAAGTLGACTTHPENGGYYLEGIAGTDKTAHSSGGVGVGGGPKIASAWVPDKYYPHGEMKLCTGMYCSETSRTVGSAQHVPAHTCAKVRFTYNSSYDVWQMKNQTYLDRCDFTDAVKVGDTDKGTPFDCKGSCASNASSWLHSLPPATLFSRAALVCHPHDSPH
jgi:hypothetical protein